jgi:hypothetical protein
MLIYEAIELISSNKSEMEYPISRFLLNPVMIAGLMVLLPSDAGE